jgi:hypothetical protein
MAHLPSSFRCKLQCFSKHHPDLTSHSGDLIHSVISSTPPRLPPPPTASIFSEYPSLHMPGPSQFTPAHFLFVTEVTTLISLYANLTSPQPHASNTPYPTPCSTLTYTQLSHALEHRLLRLTPPPTLDPEVLLHIAAQTTLKLIASLAFRTFSPRSTALRTLQAHLTSTLVSLEASADATLDAHESHMLLWILWTGAVASTEPERYVSWILRLARRLELRTWLEMKDLLEEFVWSVRLENHACWDLCRRCGLLVQDSLLQQVAR